MLKCRLNPFFMYAPECDYIKNGKNYINKEKRVPEIYEEWLFRVISFFFDADLVLCVYAVMKLKFIFYGTVSHTHTYRIFVWVDLISMYASEFPNRMKHFHLQWSNIYANISYIFQLCQRNILNKWKLVI